MDEFWVTIDDFPDYSISNHGRVASNVDEAVMRSSETFAGDVKITLRRAGERYTVSVKLLVAKAFIMQPREMFNSVIVKDNDKTNLHVSNLAWRPTWFAWKYAHQFKEEYPHHFYDLPIVNMTTLFTYLNFVDAGIADGVLFKDVFKAGYTGEPIFPTGHLYQIPKKLDRPLL